jgi:DNA-binding CsgD family transcriptional regulator
MIGLAAAAVSRQLKLRGQNDAAGGRERSRMAKDVLALICPDWRGPMLVIDGRSNDVLYANLPCLALFERSLAARIVRGRLNFTAAEFDNRFYAKLGAAVEESLETVVVTGYEPASNAWVSAIIRNTQGFFRDTLQRVLNAPSREAYPVVVEIAWNSGTPDPFALAAFAEASGLSQLELQTVRGLAMGQSVEDMASAAKLAASTVRQRLKSILTKTHTRRQAELMRLVMSLCPADGFNNRH